MLRFVLASVCFAGCATAAKDVPSDGRGSQRDASHSGGSDGRIVTGDAPKAIDGLTAVGGTLLLSEVCTAPGGSEFIEIVNPTTMAVTLDNYYLSDNGNYFKLPDGPPTVTSGDFIAHFPTGDSLASGGVMTVALGSSMAFKSAFGGAPTYSVADGSITTVTAVGTPSLTDAGEVVVLFYWDGGALVQDVDILIAGTPTSGNSLTPSKSGVALTGGSYKTDAMSIAAQGTALSSGVSTKRIALEAGHETQNGNGNGITGDDETSEDTSATWDTTYSAPTPGQVPAAL